MLCLYIEMEKPLSGKACRAIEKELNSKDFIIVDRGYLANIKHVMKMKNRDLYIRNGEIIAVGRERFKYGSERQY